MHVVGALEHDGVPEIGGVAGVLEHGGGPDTSK